MDQARVNILNIINISLYSYDTLSFVRNHRTRGEFINTGPLMTFGWCFYLSVFISVYQECCCSEVAALDPERRATRGEGEFLHDVEVHVEDPQLLLLLRRHEDEVRGGDVERSHGGVPGVDVVKQLDIFDLQALTIEISPH